MSYIIKKKYKVSLADFHELNPEETLSDAVSSHDKIEMPIQRRVFNASFLLLGVVFVFYMFHIFRLQVSNGPRLAAAALNVNSARYFSVPLRGTIYDSHGQPFVENVPNFELIALTNELKKQKPEKLKQSIDQLAGAIGQTSSAIEEAYSANQHKPVFEVKTSLSKEEVLKIQGFDTPGFYVIYDSIRHHIDGPHSAHLVGYTSKVSSEDIESDPYYKLTDRVGKSGLEVQYENLLRGERKPVLLGTESVGENNSKPGHDLHTSVSKNIQEHLYTALTTNGVGRGAAVIQNPKTGEVLGLVSIPSFDNNLFETGTDGAKIQNLLENPSRPIFNRVIGGKYSPGSTVKPLLALAGLKEKVVTPETKINSNGGITINSIYDPSVSYTFRDWKVHGITDIRKAIAWSVDVYFYALGGGYENIKGLGAEKVAQYFKTFLADQLTGIDLPGEIPGFVPTPEWKEQSRGEPWYIGDTYNLSIGQGDLSVTPIWLNSYVGAIANNGKIMKPYIVTKITNTEGQVISETSPQTLTEIPFDQDVIRVVKEGMRQTITDGTAGLLKDLPVPVAAKTGTAQTSSSTTSRLNSLFTVFGPYDDPTFTMTILVEGIGSGTQGTAIRVANTFLSWYLASESFRKN